MKFKFSLENLLKVRKNEEVLAQQNFFEAKSNLDICLRDIDDMYKRIDHYREQSVTLMRGEGTNSSFLFQIDEYIWGQEEKIKSARQKARELMQIVEEKEEILVNAAKEYKIIEKLREKRLESFLEEVKRKELHEMDDMATMRFNKRGLK